MGVIKEGTIEMIKTCMGIVLLVFSVSGTIVHAEWESDAYKELQRAFYLSPFFKGFTDDQLHTIQADIQHMIRDSETLQQEEKPIEAIRVLFDAMYTEQRTQLLLGVDGTKQFPSVASHALDQLGTSLFEEDQSLLGQRFRDPDFSIQKKQQYIADLRAFVGTRRQHGEESLFHGHDGGIFLQLMTTPRLSDGEKFHLLWYIPTPVSAAQQGRIQENIGQLREDAERKLNDHQYVDAFLAIENAEQHANDLHLFSISPEDDRSLTSQSVEMRAIFLRTDTSPLMQFFKSRLISSEKKQRALSALHDIRLQEHHGEMHTLRFEGEEFTGPLVHIMSHPKLSDRLKSSILRGIQETMIEK